MGKEKEATKDSIFTALIQLMEQKEYKYITVTDIARKSGVSRMTYYRTYSSKEDILVQYFRKTAQSMVSEANGDAGRALSSFFSFFLEKSSIAKLLAQADLTKLLIECFSVLTDFLYEALHQDSWKEPENSYAARFESGGLFSILTRWLETGTKESPDDMAAITLKILKRQDVHNPGVINL
ncbi:MAG: TetR/AcrR family transcriptional regulator [Lachnospiraceae bacterium]|nr:TetR/AcrR family transcriptional regulator [Lachnospiraceae bacterium]